MHPPFLFFSKFVIILLFIMKDLYARFTELTESISDIWIFLFVFAWIIISMLIHCFNLKG